MKIRRPIATVKLTGRDEQLSLLDYPAIVITTHGVVVLLTLIALLMWGWVVLHFVALLSS